MPNGRMLITLLVVLLLGATHVLLLSAEDQAPTGPTPLTGDTILMKQSFTPILSDLPEDLAFTYSIPDAQLLPATREVKPMNVGSAQSLCWSITTEGTWFVVDPRTGMTPASFSIIPTAFDSGASATYTGALTVTVTSPEDVEGSPHRINLQLSVTDVPLSRFYVPIVVRNWTPLPEARYPNDPLYAEQWALERIAAPGAWSISSGEGVVIAVLDTGVDLDHPDLEDKILTDLDQDFVNDDLSADDDHGHGTHVAGIAAAATDNDTGVAGVGWYTQILPLKVLTPADNGSATGTVKDMAEAIRYAADHGADIINLSLGAPGLSCTSYNDDVPEVREAIDYAFQTGVLLIAAGGNDRLATEMFPANCEHVLGVSATDRDNEIASYSSRGNHVTVSAPGGTYDCPTCPIYSTVLGGGYGWLQGTSMSTPHVAGLAALLVARYPTYTADQVASALLDNAMDLGTVGWDEVYGCGRIDAYASLSVGAHGPEPLCLEHMIWSEGEGEVQGPESSPEAPFAPGEILVDMRPGLTAAALLDRYSATAEYVPALDAWHLQVPVGQERAILSQLRRDPGVLRAGLNYLVFAQ